MLFGLIGQEKTDVFLYREENSGIIHVQKVPPEFLINHPCIKLVRGPNLQAEPEILFLNFSDLIIVE